MSEREPNVTDMDGWYKNGLKEGYQSGRDEIIEAFEQLLVVLERPAHTYASENADHYRGFDAGVLRCRQAWDLAKVRRDGR